MTGYQELFDIAAKLSSLADASELTEAEPKLDALERAASEVGRAFSGSWLGYHANVYYADLSPAPAGAHFSQEWGLKDLSFTSLGSRGDWQECDPEKLKAYVRAKAGNPDLTSVIKAAQRVDDNFQQLKADVVSVLSTENPNDADAFLKSLGDEIAPLEPVSVAKVLQIWAPSGQVMTRDMIAMGQGWKIPPHETIRAEVVSIKHSFGICKNAAGICRKAASHLERKAKRGLREGRVGTNVFIGHGRSNAWRDLKDFIQDRLHLPWDEFNRVPVAGVTNQARLSEMLEASSVAFLIMTAEDQNMEGEMQARMNVIHEVGLFQGRLGFTKAIIMLEDGCAEFSNIHGIGQIRFPSGNISASFEDVRRVLEREGLIQ